MPNGIHGFKVGNQTVKYDYQYLENLPEAELPVYGENEYGKALFVNDSSSYLEWRYLPSELPDYTSNEEGKVLTVRVDTNNNPILVWERPAWPLSSGYEGDGTGVLVTDSTGGDRWEDFESLLSSYMSSQNSEP